MKQIHLYLSAILASAPLLTSACSANKNISKEKNNSSSASAAMPRSAQQFAFADSINALKYSHSFLDSKLPTGASFFFTDYPVSEDAAAALPERTQALAKAIKAFKAKEGRAPNPVEIAHLNLANEGYNLTHKYAELEGGVKGLLVSAINRSDDIDSNLSITLGNADTVRLEPHKTYEVSGRIEFYSNTGTGGIGVGGAPDAVQIGFSASSKSWGRTESQGFWRTTLGGAINTNPFGDADYVYLGNVTNGFEMGSKGADTFVLNEANNENQPITVRTGDDHLIHVNFRTHSGFGSLSTWLVKSVAVTLEPIDVIATASTPRTP